LRHPNVVSVLDVGQDEQGPFLVMDYVEGVPASSLLRNAARSGTPNPMQVCLRVALDTAEGLHAAHELRDGEGRSLGLVHRDVSPQNLLVGFDGVTRVTDFGVAKAFGRTTKTATGVLKGKFGYMAPEQLRFEEPDRRADLFSLGVVMFELLSGERLYRSVSGMDGVRRILHEPPPDIGEYREDAPPELVQLLFSLLAKDASSRPPDAQTVARRIEPILTRAIEEEGRLELPAYMSETFADARGKRQALIRAGIEARSIPVEVPVDLAPRRSFRWAWAALAVAAVLSVAAGLWWVNPGDSTPTAAPSTAASPADDGQAVAESQPPMDMVARAGAGEGDAREEAGGGDEPGVGSGRADDGEEAEAAKGGSQAGSGATSREAEDARSRKAARRRARQRASSAESRDTGRRETERRRRRQPPDPKPSSGSGVPQWDWQ
jgi:serine/threonine-protein kinase